MKNQSAAFREEKIELQTYLYDAKTTIAENKNKLREHIIPSPESFDTDAVSQEMPQAYKDERNLYEKNAEIEITLDAPYFKRFDVSGEGENTTFYVGEHEAEFPPHVVYQWQEAGERPLLDFLMQGSGDQYFTDDYGTVHERLLDRSIAIQNGKLMNVRDVYRSDSSYAQLGINDPFLIDVIRRRRKEGLDIANIISTVQRKQYEIIRYPDESFVVQGCAGSGKTYIMMNRLSYLLFNYNTFHLSPDNVIIISPNPRIQFQLANVILDLNIEAVHQTTIEKWYINLLQQYSLRFDNSIIELESSLPRSYENEVFSPSFLKKIYASINRERVGIYSQAHALMNDSTIRSWAQIRSIVPTSSDKLSEMIAFIRTIDKEARRIERDFHSYCESNSVSEYELENLILDDSALEAQRQEISSIDAEMSEILRYNPLFEEYRAALELLTEENETYNRHKEEVKSKLQSSLRKIRDIDNMAPEERTAILTKHLHLEADNASFEDGGTNTMIHLDHVNDCKSMMSEAWDGIVTKLPARYQTNAEDAQNAMRDECDALLRRKTELEETISKNIFRTSQHRMRQKRASELHSAMMPQEKMKLLTEFARDAGNLPLRARDIAARILKELKQKHAIPLIIDNSDEKNTTGTNSKKRILYRSDLFIFLLAVTKMSDENFKHSWKLICFDEAQDVSRFEYALIQELFGKNTKLNIFGDIRQGRKDCESSIHDWSVAFPSFEVLQLNENYRNARQITERMNKHFSTKMLAIGIDGKVIEARQEERKKLLQSYINGKSAGWIIVHNRDIFNSFIASQNITVSSSRLSFDIEDGGSLIVVLTIDKIKGLEFPRVLVITDHMDDNQKYIAMTRALSELYII